MRWDQRIKKNIKKNKEIVFLLLILLLAFFLRFWRLSSIPPGLYPDVAVNGTDAIKSLNTGKFPVFYPANNGREGLFINLIVFSFYLFGISIWSIRVVAALFGFLTVLGIYLLVKELFNQKIALFASFFLAVCFWHLNFSRVGFRAIVLPFVLVYSFYFLFRGLRTNKWFNFILGGAIFGLGFHTYISWRLSPMILVLWVIYKIIRDKSFFFQYWKKLSIFVLFSFLTACPLLYYFYLNPADFMGRAGDVSVFKEPNFVKIILLNSLKALGMFNFFGDFNWRHNLAGAPMFDIILGILFLGGIIISVKIIISKDNKRNNNQKDIFVFLILWFWAMLLPTILSNEGIPHALRALGVIPVSLIFAAYFLNFLLEKKFWSNYKPKTKTIFVSLILILIFILEFNRYFIVWANHPSTHGAFTEDLVNMGNYFNHLGHNVVKYVVVNDGGVIVDGWPMPIQTIKFVTYNKSFPKFVTLEEIKKINYLPSPSVVVFLKRDDNLLKYLKNKFPSGREEVIDLNPGYNTQFYAFIKE